MTDASTNFRNVFKQTSLMIAKAIEQIHPKVTVSIQNGFQKVFTMLIA